MEDEKDKSGETALALAKKGATVAHAQIVTRLQEETKGSRTGRRRRDSTAANRSRTPAAPIRRAP